jgi:hypothetical protein
LPGLPLPDALTNHFFIESIYVQENRMLTKGKIAICSMAISLLALSNAAMAATKPNILLLRGDDIGVWNACTYNRGGMGYSTHPMLTQ